jgi:octaheme c-type cytochrome (tetrathionate reductase family)
MRTVAIPIAVVSLLIAGVVFAFTLRGSGPVDNPWVKVPPPISPTDHHHLIQGPFSDGPSVTRACLECHPDAARQLMKTSHWSWAGQKVKLPGREEVIAVGKKNLINNFCIAAGPNIAACSACHAGYGWFNEDFDFTKEENVDCLICHEQSGVYEKGLGGQPAKGVDLLAVARSVGPTTRRNCGACHFKGGGGDAVKHGDLDGSMYHPSQRIDVHMGRADFRCSDCHQTREHRIPGCAMSVCIDRPSRVNCTDCHSETPHVDQRLNEHTATVACQTCHIPRMAIDAPTKMAWDWSTAGQDLPEDPHTYLKAKGSFTYAQDVRPEYDWYDGRAYRYLTGDKIDDPSQVVPINLPIGGPGDADAKIWPFKVHRGKQVYDKKYKHLLTPRTWGEGGFWNEFDWDKACRLGETPEAPYSGEYGFVETVMYWPLSHMVQPKEKALQCNECHGPQGVMDFKALGFDGDPMFRGDRRVTGLLRTQQGGEK